ncbi:MAG: hypothetical protein Q8J97_06680, partial [Flavobacteriaceae bacterium]|nr:hypothetical protein [Flavobacteriaceae bacterium]
LLPNLLELTIVATKRLSGRVLDTVFHFASKPTRTDNSCYKEIVRSSSRYVFSLCFQTYSN